jgi:predicted  nucleic acid-binding Zn-ribbon protein
MGENQRSVEDAIRELQSLAKKHPLKGSELENAKNSMAILREAGYTNQEVSKLTNGMWGEPTVKLYSRGTEVKDSTIKGAALNLLSDVVRSGMTLDDIQALLSLKRHLDSVGLNAENVSLLLKEAERVGLNITPLVFLFQDIKQSIPNASIDDFSNIAYYKTQLEKLGMGAQELSNLVKALEAYAEPKNVLYALSRYGSIKSLEDKIGTVSAQKAELDGKVSTLQVEIKDLENKKAKVQGALDLYNNLRSAGFDLTDLASVADACKKYGPNVRTVLEAVNTYAKMNDLLIELEEVEASKKEQDQKLVDAKKEYGHLHSAIAMSQTLLFDLSYSISTIEELHELARKYGRPEELFEAVSRYGDLIDIEKEIENLLNKKTRLDSDIKEMQTQLEALRGHANTLRETVKESLKPLSSELARIADNIFEKVTTAYHQQYARIKKESEDYAKRLSEAKILEEELNMARVLNSIIKYPTEANNLPLDYPLRLLDAVERICWAKGINPMITLGGASITENPFISDFKVYLQQLLMAAKTALLRGYVPVR